MLLSSVAITIKVVSHVTIRLAVGNFLWVVHCDHGSITLPCTVMEIWRLKSWTHGRTDGRLGDFILSPMLCIAFDRQKFSVVFLLRDGVALD